MHGHNYIGHNYIVMAYIVMPTANAEGYIESEGSVGKVSVRRVSRPPQNGTGPRRSPSACSEMLKKTAALRRWMTVDGNHERNCPCTVPPPSALAAGITWLNGSDSGGECGVPYEARFPMPSAVLFFQYLGSVSMANAEGPCRSEGA